VTTPDRAIRVRARLPQGRYLADPTSTVRRPSWAVTRPS